MWNYGLNFKKMDAAKVKHLLAEGRKHLNFMMSIYRKQLLRG